MIRMVTQLFPLWALLLSFIAYSTPDAFVGLKGYIVPLLTIIMLTMGLTLKPSDFAGVLSKLPVVGVGLILQFSVMPIAALLISIAMGFDTELTVGMVLVGSVAGGTASNVMCYLARGDVALSISMTALSTLVGVVATPFLVQLLVGQTVDVPVTSMLVSLLKIVLAPVIIGVILNVLLQSTIKKVEPVLPVISMVAIVVIIAIVVALNAERLATIGPLVALAVILHNSLGLVFGFYVPKLLGFDEKTCRTVALEVGLQNSGLATALAMKYFTPASAVAGTIFSIWHNLSGSVVAALWARKVKQAEEEQSKPVLES
ncbi:bile acid:sodium symporter family protein [Vibrio genomosp. F10]|uniref:Bile acid:sodium symporter n=1 Tax=Vibrio genomosp. F10 str. ZF-129 TaxID=1187848 RepID=A0A1E5BJ11_9VIBR|nr:bile acid:sodium symporter family protein [Vibrio genomosp. F10]OEE37485.1 bile acid:sodium symporter [Vibrio genomosp. F10 str. ZF-129]OEE93058.1 bile acid:sodium symporter [Vibrio genomosp. F10 str. 9ZC157]OEE98344.1 bile acid:sodium symporter [Vibrio genomosp. F10 str. 9ZD137]OEF07510.1 bile acid:sodium symporter [Vibrio genomosp. F10 str. 9ZB36]